MAKINCYLRQKTQRQKCLILLIQQNAISIGFFDTRQKSARGLRERPAATGASDKGGSGGKRTSSADSPFSSDSGAAMRGRPFLRTGRPGPATKDLGESINVTNLFVSTSEFALAALQFAQFEVPRGVSLECPALPLGGDSGGQSLLPAGVAKPTLLSPLILFVYFQRHDAKLVTPIFFVWRAFLRRDERPSRRWRVRSWAATAGFGHG